MLEYPYDEDERLHDHRCWRRIGFAIFLGIVLALILGPLLGCATPEEPVKVCYMKPMGNTDEGYIVVAQQCMTPEAFAESQK